MPNLTHSELNKTLDFTSPKSLQSALDSHLSTIASGNQVERACHYLIEKRSGRGEASCGKFKVCISAKENPR